MTMYAIVVSKKSFNENYDKPTFDTSRGVDCVHKVGILFNGHFLCPENGRLQREYKLNGNPSNFVIIGKKMQKLLHKY